jgi:putative ABC transport system permease protein
MLRNYLTVGLRALAKNRVYAVINILGLAIGMAACILILLFVRYETSYDAWMTDADRTFQVQTFHHGDKQGIPARASQSSAYVAGTMLRKDFPQIEKLVYLGFASPVIMQDGQATTAKNFFFTDGQIFDVLGIPLVRGDRRSILAAPGGIALSQSEATRRFGAADPIGKTLTLIGGGKSTDYHVTGVFQDLPKNSHLIMNAVARYDPVSYFADYPDFLTAWGWQSGIFYGRMKPGIDVAVVNRQMTAWKKRNIPDETVGTERTNQGDYTDWALTPLRAIHLGEAQDSTMTPGNDRRTIVTFAVVALLILGMACVNFTNLATARASQRAREVALRKVLGASRRQLIAQFLGESVLVAALAMIVALAMTELLLPLLNAFLKADMHFRYFGWDGLLLPVLVLVLVVGAAGGIYPALFLSRFRPAGVLRGSRSSTDSQGSGKLRNVLVVGQFAVSIGLIICTAVIYAQTVYARTSNPGFRRDGLIQVDNIGRRALFPLVDTLLREIARIDGVTSIGRTTIGVATSNSSNSSVLPLGSTKGVTTGIYSIDPGFIPTMGIKLIAGRNFVEGRAMDDATVPDFPPNPVAETAMAHRGRNVILNEVAARRLGFAHPADALGKTLKAELGDAEKNGMTLVTVIGIAQDSRFRSIRDPLDPIMFSYDRIAPDYLMVRYSGSPQAVRDRIAAVWKRIAPDVPFEADYTDDIVRDLYEAEAARADIFAAFAGLSVIVGCLGLFGLAAFTAERRTKEIGIRKVLGARTHDIVRLLVWQFTRPVLIANLIAWPVAWWVMRDWLNKFDARIALGPVPFLVAGGLALGIAVATIATHAFRVARANPIVALRYE